VQNSIYSYSKFYGFFTKYSLLGNYGFFNGLRSRITQKILPEYIEEDSFEHFVLNAFKKKQSSQKLSELIEFNTIDLNKLQADLYLSIISLCSKVTSVGLDKKIKYKLESLSLDVELFATLTSHCAQINNREQKDIDSIIEEIQTVFDSFRKQKNKFGTSIQLTYKTSLVKKYLNRLKLLVQLYYNNSDLNTWDLLINKYAEEHSNHKSVLKYFKYHFDLVLLQAVEHTSKQGQKYIAVNHKEYMSFLRKSMLAGATISIFATIKIYLDSKGLSSMNNALLYSLNYAACFISAKKLGGIIATKQPAMTASTISKFVDQNDNFKVDNAERIINIIKNTSRSQFISFIGNVAIALPLTCLIFYLANAFIDGASVSTYKANVLLNETSAKNIINLYYAAIAGIFLSLSGFISGYVDNKMVFTKARYRIQESSILNLFFSKATLKKHSVKIENNIGASVGNICLGLFLGSSFLIGEFFSIPFDIRHIAFSASYLGILIAKGGLSILDFSMSFLGVWLIGTVNFLVSFCITLFITLKTRGITINQLSEATKGLLKDVFYDPFSFIIFKKSKS